jgi:predicted secreted protein
MKTFKSGESIEVRVAEEFEVCLTVLAVSGYKWEVAEKTTKLAFLGSSIRALEEDKIGGASQQTLQFRAEQPGTFDLHLVCKREWDTTPSETLTMQVTVHGHK